MPRNSRKAIVGKVESIERGEREEAYALLAFTLHQAHREDLKPASRRDLNEHKTEKSCVYSGFKPTFPVAFTQKNSPPIAFPQVEKSIALISVTRE